MTEARRLLVLLYTGWMLAAAAAAAATSAWFAAAARRTLKVHFVLTFRHPLAEAVSIWLSNSLAVAGAAICVALILFAHRLAPAARGIGRIPWWVCDLLFTIAAARTAVLAGILIGAYGTAQLRAFLPDGPVEVLAWALLACIYIQARRQCIGLRGIAIALLSVEVLLALAALLEASL